LGVAVDLETLRPGWRRRVAAFQLEQERRRGQVRRVGADEDAEEQREGEVGQGVAAQEEQRRQDEQRRDARVDRAWEHVHDDGVDDGGEVVGGAGVAGFADAVEDDDRVVHGVADDREDRGQEDAVDRFAGPGEDTDHDGDVLHQCEDGAGAEGPAEARGQIQQLCEQRDAERDQALVPQLLTERRADVLVADQLGATADPGDGLADLLRLAVADRRCPHG